MIAEMHGRTMLSHSEDSESGAALPNAFMGRQDAKQWRKQYDKLLQIRGLRDGWDGCSGTAPKPGLVDTALNLLRLLQQSPNGWPAPSRVVPTSDGIIIMEWNFSGGRFVSAEVESPNRVEWMNERPGHPVQFQTQSIAAEPPRPVSAESVSWGPFA